MNILETTEDRRLKRRRLLATALIFVGGILILINGYYWSVNSRIAHFIWSGAYRMTWWSSTGHIPLFYWGVTCGILVLLGAMLTLVPRDSISSFGTGFAMLLSIFSVVASGGWMVGFILVIVGGILRVL